MTEATKLDPPRQDLGILDCLADRRPDRRMVRRLVRNALRGLRAELAACGAYRGGLRAELEAASLRKNAAVKAARLEARRAVLSRIGRRIDLGALLRQRRPDGAPAWAIMDPTCRLQSWHNGFVCDSGEYRIGGRCVAVKGAGKKGQSYLAGGGIPPLPPVVRRLATDKTIRRRARWVGLLYQPAQWMEVHPDPALIVEWLDRPGEYYALAVWGQDRPGIMEFVD